MDRSFEIVAFSMPVMVYVGMIPSQDFGRIKRRSFTFLIVRRLTACLPFTSPPICQALTLNALGGNHGAFEIAHMAGVIAEIEFTQVSLEVLGRNPLVVTGDAALED